jgi:hypothetical protein
MFNNLVIKLLPNQIPQYWEQLKYVMTKADDVNDKYLSVYLNDLLNALLNNKAQCWLKFDDNKTLQGVALTRIETDKITGEKYLHLQSFYSFTIINENICDEGLTMLKQFAKDEQCSYIFTSSSKESIWKICQLLGFNETDRNFVLKIM